MLIGSTRVVRSLCTNLMSKALLSRNPPVCKHIKQFSGEPTKKNSGLDRLGCLSTTQFLEKEKNRQQGIQITGTDSHKIAQIVPREDEDRLPELKALDHPKTSQSLWNNTVGRLPFFNMIEAKSCTKEVILEDFKKYLIRTKPIQFSRGCLFEVIRIIDHWNKRESIFDNMEIKRVLSGELKVEKATINDIFVRSTLKHHLMDHDDDQKDTAPSEKSFITGTVGHFALSSVYMSAFEIQEHLDKVKQPLYTMVTWGKSEAEAGYGAHAIIVFGVDRKDQVYFWDVSDKLGDAHSRIRTMNIEEFNDRRNMPPEPGTLIKSGYSRKDIYYFKSRKES